MSRAPDQSVTTASTTPAIRRREGVLGGAACIRDTRITVWGLVEWRRLGRSDADLLQSIAGLRPGGLDTAWEYAARHLAEIDEAIRRNAAV